MLYSPNTYVYVKFISILYQPTLNFMHTFVGGSVSGTLNCQLCWMWNINHLFDIYYSSDGCATVSFATVN